MAIDSIVVNLKRAAACCTLDLLNSYTRDLATGLVYHNRFCLAAHVNMTQKAIEYAKTSQVPAEDFYR